MGKSGGAEQQVIDYRLSVHYGVCLGPVDAVTRVRIGEKDIGIVPVETSTSVAVNKRNLFGGPKKGGGVEGVIDFFFGDDDQVMTPEVASKYGRTPETMSGQRGFLSLFFRGHDASGAGSTGIGGLLSGVDTGQGFYWGSNNPIVPAVEVTARRSPKTDLDDESMIGGDANPSHIIYECLRNYEWGCGYPSERCLTDSFLNAAETLRNENFGMSLIWTDSVSLEDFVNSILQQISANLTFSVATGEWELKLLRGDYQANRLPEVNPGNATMVHFERKGWGETINTMILTWLNPENEKEEAVTLHDNANISIQQGLVSDSSRVFDGIRSQDLALRAAARELRQVAAPLAAAEVEVDRGFWKLGVGSVVNFKWPEKQIEEPMVMRVIKVSRGKRGENKLKLNLLEDIFSFGVPVYESQDSEAIDEDVPPEDITTFRIGTAPYYLVAATMGENPTIEYPDEFAALYLATPIPTRDIDYQTEIPNANGELTFEEAGTVDECGFFETTAVLSIESSTALVLPGSYDRLRLSTGCFFVISDPNDPSVEEIAVVREISGASVLLARGVLDTVPQEWPVGSRVWVVSGQQRIVDTTERAASEVARYKFLPITALGRLEPEDATIRDGELAERASLPLRPANLRVNGLGIPEAEVNASDDDFTVSWSIRNRLTETSVVLSWDNTSVSAESGVTTTLVFYKNGSEVHRVSGLAGTSTAVNMSDVDGESGQSIRVEAFSEKSGLSSYQKSILTIRLT